MSGQMRSDEGQGRMSLVTSREPKGPTQAGDKGSQGDQALMDGIALIVAAWMFLGILVFSFRGFNV